MGWKAYGGRPQNDTQRMSATNITASDGPAIPQVIYLTMTNVASEEWAIIIEDHRKTIGRSPTAEIRIPDRFLYVSREHAEIWREKSKTYLCDLGSKSGTSVNGVWLKRAIPTSLVAGDHIWLGAVELDVVSRVSPLAELMKVGSDRSSSEFEPTASRGMATTALPVRMLLDTLTPSELDIAIWLSRGYFDDAELGRMLFRSPHTVRTQVGSVMRKLNLHSRHDIIGLLRRNDG